MNAAALDTSPHRARVDTIELRPSRDLLHHIVRPSGPAVISVHCESGRPTGEVWAIVPTGDSGFLRSAIDFNVEENWNEELVRIAAIPGTVHIISCIARAKAAWSSWQRAWPVEGWA